jgi:hypothetical protein
MQLKIATYEYCLFSDKSDVAKIKSKLKMTMTALRVCRVPVSIYVTVVTPQYFFMTGTVTPPFYREASL